MVTRRKFIQTAGLCVSLAAEAGSTKNDLTNFTVLITADLHAQLFTHDEFFWENEKAVFKKRGGLDVLKGLVNQVRKNERNVILIDAGDYFHGHAIATKTEGEALIPLINAFQYDLVLPGNWEVVYRKARMVEVLDRIKAKKICANMWHKNLNGDRGDLIYQPYWIKELEGFRIGFLGYTDHLVPKRQPPAFSSGIAYTHATTTLAENIELLRKKEHCDMVILVTHMGLAQQLGLANHPDVAGADLIIGADTHERVRVPIEGKYCKVIECGAFGSFAGKLSVKLKRGAKPEFNYELLDTDPKQYFPDPEVTRLIGNLAAPFKKEINEVIGHTSTPLLRYFVLETPIDNLITDALRWKFNTDVALSNGFRFCQPLAVEEGATTPITKEFLWNMLPLDSVARKAEVTGAQIKKWLEQELENAFATDPSKRFGGWLVRFSGMEINFTAGRPMNSRVNRVTIGGKPLEEERKYSIVACEREGDPIDTLCRIEHVSSPVSMGQGLHEVIIEYLGVHSPISPTIEGRATATDLPANLLTQLQGTSYVFR